MRNIAIACALLLVACTAKLPRGTPLATAPALPLATAPDLWAERDSLMKACRANDADACAHALAGPYMLTHAQGLEAIVTGCKLGLGGACFPELMMLDDKMLRSMLDSMDGPDPCTTNQMELCEGHRFLVRLRDRIKIVRARIDLTTPTRSKCPMAGNVWQCALSADISAAFGMVSNGSSADEQRQATARTLCQRGVNSSCNGRPDWMSGDEATSAVAEAKSVLVPRCARNDIAACGELANIGSDIAPIAKYCKLGVRSSCNRLTEADMLQASTEAAIWEACEVDAAACNQLTRFLPYDDKGAAEALFKRTCALQLETCYAKPGLPAWDAVAAADLWDAPLNPSRQPAASKCEDVVRTIRAIVPSKRTPQYDLAMCERTTPWSRPAQGVTLSDLMGSR